MELYTFENSAPGRLRADIHRYPVAFNNQIIDTFKRPVSTIGAKTLEGVVGALEKRKGKQIREILETTSLRVGDVVKIGIDPSSTDGRYTDVYL